MPHKKNANGQHHIPKMRHAVTNWAGCRFPFNLSLLIFQLALLILSICHQAVGHAEVKLARHRPPPLLGF